MLIQIVRYGEKKPRIFDGDQKQMVINIGQYEPLARCFAINVVCVYIQTFFGFISNRIFSAHVIVPSWHKMHDDIMNVTKDFY